WPRHDALDDPAAEAEIGWVIDLIGAVRSVRAEMNVPAGAQGQLCVLTDSAEIRERGAVWGDFIKPLGRVSNIEFPPAVPPQSVQVLVRGAVVALPLGGIIDIAAERGRLEKERAKTDSEIARIDAKLSNADFIARAPEEVVEGEREKREEAEG